MFFRLITKFASPILGKKKYQALFENLLKISLLGMNIGGGTDSGSSGEESALYYIRGRLRPGKSIVIFDVGANVGNYSILLKKVFPKKAKIHSFEPSNKTFKKLVENLGDYKDIQLYNLGLGDKKSRKTLYSNADESGLASVYKRNLNHININMEQVEKIKISTLDAFCKSHNINHIHLLKLDVEGHEKNVLAGASKMISTGAIDYIQFEFGGCNIDSKTYFKDFYYLFRDRFNIYRILRDGLQEIGQYEEIYETFITTNYLAEKKEMRS